MDMENNDTLPRLSRRDVIKWFAAAAAASQAAPFLSLAQNAPPAAQGYGTDPKVAGIHKAGDFWPLTLTSAQRKTVTALADVILPADSLGPAASALRVPDYIDELDYVAEFNGKNFAFFLKKFFKFVRTYLNAFHQYSRSVLCDDSLKPSPGRKCRHVSCSVFGCHSSLRSFWRR